MAKTRVLIVDDSAIVRKLLTEALSTSPDIEVVGTAPDPLIARQKILTLHPQVLTLDIEMPRMDGLTFLQQLMQENPMPVIIISSLAQPSAAAALQALALGAVEVVPKPGGPYSVGELRHQLPHKIRSAAQARLPRLPLHPNGPAAPRPAPDIAPPGAATSPARCPDLIAIGASTGGTEAIRHILEHLPADCPPIAIVQHIPPVFSAAFADRLNKVCRIRVREAREGDRLERGLALLAPGDQHMLVRRKDLGYIVSLSSGPKICYQRPAVDVLFHSVAEAAGGKALGILLTGMGADGAQGLLRMKERGAHTIAQDETSSVVYGMPREAARIGAAQQILSLDAIAALASALGGGARELPQSSAR